MAYSLPYTNTYSIPADIRIIESFDLKVECSSLTGESDLVAATVEKKHDAAAGALGGGCCSSCRAPSPACSMHAGTRLNPASPTIFAPVLIVQRNKRAQSPAAWCSCRAWR